LTPRERNIAAITDEMDEVRFRQNRFDRTDMQTGHRRFIAPPWLAKASSIGPVKCAVAIDVSFGMPKSGHVAMPGGNAVIVSKNSWRNSSPVPVNWVPSVRNPVSGGIATSGCASIMKRRSVVPDRGAPRMTGIGIISTMACVSAILPLELSLAGRQSQSIRGHHQNGSEHPGVGRAQRHRLPDLPAPTHSCRPVLGSQPYSRHVCWS